VSLKETLSFAARSFGGRGHAALIQLAEAPQIQISNVVCVSSVQTFFDTEIETNCSAI